MSYLHNGSLRGALMVSAAIVVMASPAGAQAVKTFDIPAQDAATALPAFAQQSGLQVLAPAQDLRGVRTNAVQGAYRVDTALGRLVDGTGLTVKTNDGSAAVVVRAAYTLSAQDSGSAAAPA
ncbi:MAG: STN domain-containing protein, partial [Asticcacaulis sp.]|nr:STN domain-containing protein [Asticcacaulis sp.]